MAKRCRGSVIHCDTTLNDFMSYHKRNHFHNLEDGELFVRCGDTSNPQGFNEDIS